MAKLTRAQYDKWNSKLHNGFLLDLERFLVWGDKRAAKTIEMSDGRVLKASFEWYELGKPWERGAGVQPKLHLSVWRPTSTGMWSSSGLGKTVEITDQVYTRRSWDELAKFTAEWNEERIMAEAKKHMAVMEDARIA